MTKKDMRELMDEVIGHCRHAMGLPEDGFVLDRLGRIRDEMHNRPPQTNGDVVSEPITDEKRDAVRKDHEENPEIPQHQLAARHNINQGRISEILAGKRS